MGVIELDSMTKLLLITGASAGIGLSTASRFLSDGYTVVNLSRRPCPLQGVQHLRCDLAQQDFLEKIGVAFHKAAPCRLRWLLIQPPKSVPIS